MLATRRNAVEDRIRSHRRLLLLGALVDNGVAYSTVKFMADIYELFFDKKERTCTEMADAYSITPQAARRHVHRLTELGYLNRVHYRAWEINADGIQSLVVH